MENSIEIPSVVDVEWAKQEMERTGKNKCNKDFVYYVQRANKDIDWIDLSTLPRGIFGNKYTIDWENVYHSVVFYYNGILDRVNLKNHDIKLELLYKGKKVLKTRSSIKNVSLMGLLPRQVHNDKVELEDSLFNDKEAMKYVVEKNKAKKLSPNSHKYIKCSCYSCGRYSKEVMIKNLTTRGFSCPICKSYISYPEKVGISVLEVLNIEYKYQKTFDGCMSKNKLPFDFYIEYNGNKYAIEMNGLQHYEDCRMLSYKKTKKTDKIKKEYCINNNIKYIAIDCRKSDFNFIMNNLLHSEIGFIFTEVEEQKVLNHLHSNFKYNSKDIIDKYKSGVRISTISKEEQLTDTIVTGILQRAGIWESKPPHLKNNIRVRCKNTGDVFMSQNDGAKWCGLRSKGLNPHLRGVTKSAGKHPITGEKLEWEYVD